MGDKLFLFTDGIVEAENTTGEIYTLNRLESAIKNHITLPTEKIKDELYKDLIKFTQNKPLDDDITLLITERK